MKNEWLIDLFQDHCIEKGKRIEISCDASSGGMYTSLSIGKLHFRSDEEYWNEIVSLFEKTCSATSYPDQGIRWLITKDNVKIELVGSEEEGEMIQMSIYEFSSRVYNLIS